MPPETIPLRPAERTQAAASTEAVQLVTAREAARRLAVSERTLWGLTDRGELPAVRIGRAVRYDVRDLIAYVDRLRTK